ncbi:MAG: class I tRNA ligase family protein [Candidatus Gracilibacteria bacterium]
MYKQPNPKQNFPSLEEEIIKFWEKENIFQKSVSQRDAANEYTFYDGPPFATGLPHYGHILASTIKDMVPRYWTMRGKRVERRWGWDCHGLPVEYEKEKELGISSKKGIEEFGIGNFNEACRSTVLRYAHDWKKYVSRLGRWVDMDNDYRTMEPWFMESLWWVFKELSKKDLVYEGEKVLPYCIRCATVLSNFEATQGYVDRQDSSVTVKFRARGFQFTDDTPIYFLAWTTTPWTLPSNLALVVGPDVTYSLIKDHASEELYILGEEALARYYKVKDGEEVPYTVLNTYKGSELEGIRYEPIFDYFKEKEAEGAFKVFTADYVTTTDGTGIVHQAPYGEDDHRLLTEKGIGIVHAVDDSGIFKDEVTDYKGQTIFESNKKILSDLKEKGKVIRIDTTMHSYPHCWRCDSPLMYMPISTWFVKTTQIKEDLLSNNKKITWVPSNIKEGRFGKWLENVRDWAVSRNRYWGTPLPVWKCTDCKHVKVLGSVEELFKSAPGKITKLTLVRHGEGTHNTAHVWSSSLDDTYSLTEKGKASVKETARKYLKQATTMYVSPLHRTQETAQVIVENIDTSPRVTIDERLREMSFGVWEDKDTRDQDIQKDLQEWKNHKQDGSSWDIPRCSGAESYADLEKRVTSFLEEILEKHKGESVTIVSHGAVLRVLTKLVKSLTSREGLLKLKTQPTASAQNLYIDTTTGKEFDLHKHFVDDIEIPCDMCGSPAKRIPEVFDCWFESGSMPYAQNHFPFEKMEYTKNNFPADFIAEGQDQTRGWFYTLHVLATALSDGKSGLGMSNPAFQNVIVNGIVLAEDGKKMSKRLKNYPDPMHIFETYGADALRFYMMNSPVVQAQDLRFSEKGVGEVVKTVLLPLWNTYSFFVTYASLDSWTAETHVQKGDLHKLDRWILSELNTMIKNYNARMEAYDLKGATDLITDFLDNLTNWYIRRSRRRFWKSENDNDKYGAYATLHQVIIKVCQILAPVTPFITEEIYKNLVPNALSVHLSDFPEVDEKAIDEDLNKEMHLTRQIVQLGHSIRAREKVKVRQPLSKLEVGLPEHTHAEFFADQLEVIKEELNVKELHFVQDPSELGKLVARPNARVLGPRFGKAVQDIIREAKAGNFEKLSNGNILVLGNEITPDEVELGYESKEGLSTESEGGMVVALDTSITPELKLEGYARDLIRLVQDMRKEADLQVSDRIEIHVNFLNDPDLLEALETFKEYICRETLATQLHIAHEGKNLLHQKEVELEEITFMIRICKA